MMAMHWTWVIDMTLVGDNEADKAWEMATSGANELYRLASKREAMLRVIRALHDSWVEQSKAMPLMSGEGTGLHNCAVDLRDAFKEAFDD